MNLTINQIQTLPQQGKGKYGTVHRFGEHNAIKVTPVSPTFVGDPSHDAHILNAEYQIAMLLQYTGWVIDTYNTYTIDGVLGRIDTEADVSRVTEMKCAHYGSVLRYLRNPPKNIKGTDITDIFKTVIFQVAFALHTIYKKYPNFRHNDMTIDNVLVEKYDSKDSRTVYECESLGRKYEMRNLGYKLKLCDFGLASMSGIVDNYEMLETRMVYMNLKIGYKQDHKTDLFKFVSSLYHVLKHMLDENVRVALIKAFKGHLKQEYAFTTQFPPINTIQDLPTVDEFLLNTEVFASTSICTPSTPMYPTGQRISKPNRLVHSLDGVNKALAIRSVGDIEIVLLFVDAFGKSFILTKIPDIKERATRFLNRYVIPFRYHKVPIILAFVDIYRYTSAGSRMNDAYTMIDWIDKCKLKISEAEFADIALQWSWWGQ